MKTIDDLGDELRQVARRADDAVRLDLSALGARRRKKTRSALQRLRLALTAELVLDAAALIALGSFLAAHLTEPRFALCALVLHLVVIAQVIAVVRQLVGLRGLDLAGPVVPLQRRLETLRAERIRLTKATLLVAPLLRRLARDLAGHNLSAAQTFLDELTEMETAER